MAVSPTIVIFFYQFLYFCTSNSMLQIHYRFQWRSEEGAGVRTAPGGTF